MTEDPNYGNATDWCQSALWWPHSCHTSGRRLKATCTVLLPSSHPQTDTHSHTHTQPRKDGEGTAYPLKPILPCCVVRACGHSGSDHSPGLRVKILHCLLQQTHLEKKSNRTVVTQLFHLNYCGFSAAAHPTKPQKQRWFVPFLNQHCCLKLQKFSYHKWGTHSQRCAMQDIHGSFWTETSTSS